MFFFFVSTTTVLNKDVYKIYKRSETCTGCGGELSGVSGSFVSPNYPLPYGHSTQCFWTITVSRGSKIQLRFSDFDLETHYVCRWDVLEVYVSSLSHCYCYHDDSDSTSS